MAYVRAKICPEPGAHSTRCHSERSGPASPLPEIAPLRFPLGTRSRRISLRFCLAHSVTKLATTRSAGKFPRIRTCTNRNLNPLRMNTYEKTGRGSSRESHGHQELSRVDKVGRCIFQAHCPILESARSLLVATNTPAPLVAQGAASFAGPEVLFSHVPCNQHLQNKGGRGPTYSIRARAASTPCG